jgi:hypothetical protein
MLSVSRATVYHLGLYTSNIMFFVACAVIRSAMEDGIASKITPKVLKEGLENYVGRKMYFPKYVPLVDPGRN